jgi:cellulose synthase/poly-beta-1,6-N-acetylglucosamine synthase-like glycosyltransferase
MTTNALASRQLAPEDQKLLSGKRILVVMPAYNAAQTLERTWRQIPSGWVSRIILVDDASHDETAEIAEALPLEVIKHHHNVGYGGNQKTCYTAALRAATATVARGELTEHEVRGPHTKAVGAPTTTSDRPHPFEECQGAAVR